jgi:hypothetical protein
MAQYSLFLNFIIDNVRAAEMVSVYIQEVSSSNRGRYST